MRSPFLLAPAKWGVGPSRAVLAGCPFDAAADGEPSASANGDYVVQAEKNTGAPIKRINTQGVEVIVVDTDKLYYVTDGQGNLKAGSTQPTERPIYNEQGEVIGTETIPSTTSWSRTT